MNLQSGLFIIWEQNINPCLQNTLFAFQPDPFCFINYMSIVILHIIWMFCSLVDINYALIHSNRCHILHPIGCIHTQHVHGRGFFLHQVKPSLHLGTSVYYLSGTLLTCAAITASSDRYTIHHRLHHLNIP